MKKIIIASALLATSFISSVNAADYIIDTDGAHASINFKVSHLGFSWLKGRFNKFDGKFSYDANDLSTANITVNIDTTSVDSNHAKRDKHIRSDDFLDASKFSTATFVSKKITDVGNDELTITGDLTMHGITKSIVIDAKKLKEGNDPWNGYRVGFTGTTKLNMGDFGLKKNFGEVLFELDVEGIRQ